MPIKLSRTGLAIVFLTLLAPVMGGSTQFWAQGTLVLLTGLCILVAPPRRGPSLVALILFLGLAGLALTAFLPAGWFGVPHWRARLVEEFGAVLPGTRSPQPWLSWEWFQLLAAGLVWCCYLQCREWKTEERRGAMQLFVFGIAGLAAVAAAAFFTKHPVPWWTGPPEKAGKAWEHSSFFPNRNQAADVLALAGIMAYAAALDALGARRKGMFAALALCLAVICGELVLVYSRAGILLFFGGVAVWQMWSFWLSRSAQRAALALGAVLLVLAGFFLAGGETLERFEGKGLHALLHGRDFRVLIHRDALEMSKETPALGVGLGNFRSLFPMYRERSVQEDVALHPESDWLWLAVEMGWVAVGVAVVGIGVWLWRCFPFETGTSRFLRSAAAVCGCGFALHGLVDVSAHRLGSLWPALFLASLAVRPKSTKKGGGWAAPVIFRLLGLGMALTGSCWLASSQGVGGFRTSAAVAQWRARAADLIAQKDYEGAIAASTKAIAIAPVDWTLYFQRGAAEAQASIEDSAALRDFATARYLEPHWERLCLQEGALWLAADKPDYALNAWTEAMRRALEPSPARTQETAPEMYRQMLSMTQPDTELRAQVRELARKDTDTLLQFLEGANGLEFDIESMGLLERDPGLKGLNEEQRARFFKSWFVNGDRYSLADTLEGHPEFVKAGWRWLAACYANEGQYEKACETVFQYAPAPAMPAPEKGKSLADLQRAYFADAHDLQAGVALAQAQEQAGQPGPALITLGSVRPAAAPVYFPYLEGRLLSEKGDWKEAWGALGAFVGQ